MYFDTHAHYDDRRYDADRNELFETLPKAGVDYVINVSVDLRTSFKSVEFAEKHGFIYAAVGVHPSEALTASDADIESVKKLCSSEKVVAVGEIGLDYHYDDGPPKDVQKRVFKRLLAVASSAGLPVAVHSRDAASDTFDAIVESGVRKGVIHCFSGGAQLAQDYVKLGFHIGVGGVVTFPNAKKLKEAVETVPIDRILLETDCPYLTPQQKRGLRNDSQNLSYICAEIARIRQIEPEEIARITTENALKLFAIK
ncbi:MAG: TatD family hydrolase [Clostridiales bacterium]|jgi:TatD DNase family protein|nr:TatD family hydrolase [Clostridiales bacterium]